MIRSIFPEFRAPSIESRNPKRQCATNDIVNLFKSASLPDRDNLTDKRIAQIGGSAIAGTLLAAFAATTGLTVALHEVAGHGLLGIQLTQQSGRAPTYHVDGWERFNKMLGANSFKEGVSAFIHWILPWDQEGVSGWTYRYPDLPNELGKAMGREGRSAWISVAGSIPGLALDALSVSGGMHLRKRSPILGNLLVGFGLTDGLLNAVYPITAARMSESQMQIAATSGHDFVNFALKMSKITGIAARTIAISTAIFWTACVPIVALLAYLNAESQIENIVPDLFALQHWIQKAESNPKIAAELEKHLRSFPYKDRLATVKIEDLKSGPLYCPRLGFANLDWLRLCQIDPPPRLSREGKDFVVRNGSLRFGCVSQSPNSQNLNGSSIFYKLIDHLFDQIPAQDLDLSKKEILNSWEKKLQIDPIQAALAKLSLIGTITAIAAKTFEILALAAPPLQIGAAALGTIAPLFVGASILSTGYDGFKDYTCSDSVVPKSVQMQNCAKLVASVSCAALIGLSFFVPGLNQVLVGTLFASAILNALFSYSRSQRIREEFKNALIFQENKQGFLA